MPFYGTWPGALNSETTPKQFCKIRPVSISFLQRLSRKPVGLWIDDG